MLVIAAVKKLEFGVLKLYLVTAFTAGKIDKITEFYTKLATELHSQPEWKDWFCTFSIFATSITSRKINNYFQFIIYSFPILQESR